MSTGSFQRIGVAANLEKEQALALVPDILPALAEAGLRDKIRLAIGGACCSQQLADEMRVDAYGEDAIKAVRIFEKLAESMKQGR